MIDNRHSTIVSGDPGAAIGVILLITFCILIGAVLGETFTVKSIVAVAGIIMTVCTLWLFLLNLYLMWK